MRAFLLAAGFGTRLRPLTLCRPKPLVPVCGVPMLDYAVALLEQHGIHGAVVNAHWLPEQIQAWAERHPMELRVSVETPDILGTGGGLRAARKWLAEGFVVVNGDILCDVDLGALLVELEGSEAVMALRTLDADQGYSVVAADSEGVVVDLAGLATATPHGAIRRGTHFTGIHALRRTMLDVLPPGESCIVRQGYAPQLARRTVSSIHHSGSWFDVGTPQAYLQANLLAVGGELSLPLDPHSRASKEDFGTQVREPVWIGEGAVLQPGCMVGPRAIIGEGAVVESGAVVEHSVIWSGCTVQADQELRGAIVYDQGTLLPGMDS